MDLYGELYFGAEKRLSTIATFQYLQTTARTNLLSEKSNGALSVRKPPWERNNIKPLCYVCQKIDWDELLGLDLDLSNLRLGTKRKEINHHPSYATLIASAKDGCDLCKAIWLVNIAALNRNGKAPDRGADYGLDSTQVKCRSIWQNSWTKHGTLEFFQEGSDRFQRLQVELEVFAYDDDDVAKLIPGRPIVTNPWADSRFRLAMHWIQDCKANHDCGRKRNSQFPTRILDLGDENHIGGVVLRSGNGESGEWVALSHRWGEKRPTFWLDVDTLESLQQGILLSDLDLTFQHAISITRLLGFRYLWIDCLCIIQGHRGDWEEEAPKMGHVYGNAALTLVAESTPSSKSGMVFRSMYDNFLALGKIQFSSRRYKTTGEAYIRLPLSKCDQFMAINTRAWTLQEDLLSIRKLHFGYVQMSWSCRQCKRLEGYRDPEALIINTVAPDVSNYLAQEPGDRWQPQLHLFHNLKDQDQATHLLFWNDIVDNFAQRYLTVQADRLSAISSLARFVAGRVDSPYIAGLWTNHIHIGLMWSMLGRGKAFNENEYNGLEPPSWSWASMLHEPESQNFPHRLYQDVLTLVFAKPERQAKILAYDVSQATADDYGPVFSGGSIRIEGGLITFNTLRELGFTTLWETSDDAIFLDFPEKDPDPPGRILCRLDVIENSILEFCPIPNLCLLDIATYPGKGAKAKNFLLLVPLDEQFQNFRRAGVAFAKYDEKMIGSESCWEIRQVRIF